MGLGSTLYVEPMLVSGFSLCECVQQPELVKMLVGGSPWRPVDVLLYIVCEPQEGLIVALPPNKENLSNACRPPQLQT